jgi:putative ABC transport system permease protein
MLDFAMAWANVVRNRRRSISTLLAIGVGVSMIVFTNSFTDGVADNMSNAIIDQMDGHLRVNHKDYKRYYITDQENILLKGWQPLADEIRKIEHVKEVMPRVMIGGLMGIDDRTTTFFGMSSDLDKLDAVLPAYAKNLVAGQKLSRDDPSGVLVGQSLASNLGVKVGDELVLLSKTIHGDQSNTLVHIRGIVTFPSSHVVEQSLMLTGLSKPIKEDLLDLGDNALQLVVRLDDGAYTEEVQAKLDALIAAHHLPWATTPWNENEVYARVVGMFKGIGGLITFVLTLMVAVITSNALLMAFFERIREVGTLRAIGMSRGQVYQLLYLESAIVGLTGALGGLLIGFVLTAIARGMGIPIGLLGESVYPMVSTAGVIVSVVAPLVCIVLAAAVPIRAATRMNVIDAVSYQ